MKPESVREDDWREHDCIGCKKHIEGMYDRIIWGDEYKGWNYVSKLESWLCPDCYPIYKNLISIFKKSIRKDFVEARAEMNFRMNENLKEYW